MKLLKKYTHWVMWHHLVLIPEEIIFWLGKEMKQDIFITFSVFFLLVKYSFIYTFSPINRRQFKASLCYGSNCKYYLGQTKKIHCRSINRYWYYTFDIWTFALWEYILIFHIYSIVVNTLYYLWQCLRDKNVIFTTKDFALM